MAYYAINFCDQHLQVGFRQVSIITCEVSISFSHVATVIRCPIVIDASFSFSVKLLRLDARCHLDRAELSVLMRHPLIPIRLNVILSYLTSTSSCPEPGHFSDLTLMCSDNIYIFSIMLYLRIYLICIPSSFENL